MKSNQFLRTWKNGSLRILLELPTYWDMLPLSGPILQICMAILRTRSQWQTLSKSIYLGRKTWSRGQRLPTPWRTPISLGDDMESASQALLELLATGEKVGQLLIIVPALCELASIKRVQGRLQTGRETL